MIGSVLFEDGKGERDGVWIRWEGVMEEEHVLMKADEKERKKGRKRNTARETRTHDEASRGRNHAHTHTHTNFSRIRYTCHILEKFHSFFSFFPSSSFFFSPFI